MQTQPKRFWIYITASEPRGVLYIGMSSDLASRAWQHRERVIDGFTSKYGVDRLVYFEEHSDAALAAKRERAMKRWLRDWKIKLIEASNPTWRDLFPDVVRAADMNPDGLDVIPALRTTAHAVLLGRERKRRGSV
jgi:putative endonuclease